MLSEKMGAYNNHFDMFIKNKIGNRFGGANIGAPD